jgi:hypothetical protein
VPLGRASADGSLLIERATFQFPLWLDVGYRVTPHFYVGGFFNLGYIATLGCSSSRTCTGTDVRFGAMAAYHSNPEGTDSWLGAGLGYEILHLDRSRATRSDESTLAGFEIINLQAGIDFKSSRSFRLGPYGGFTFSKFVSASEDGQSVEDFPTAFHHWISLGLRGAYDL